MILSDTHIKQLLASGELSILGVNQVNVESASIDLTLGNSYAMIEPMNGVISMKEENNYTHLTGKNCILPPKKSILATTREYIKLPKNLGAIVTGRSSIGRLGLFVENAGWVDPAFEGEITLELYNSSDYPIEIVEGRRIAQLLLVNIDGIVEEPYNGKYQRQIGATTSLIFKDKDNTPKF